MALDYVLTLMLYIRLANLGVSAYLLYLVGSTIMKYPKGSFSRTMQLMMVAVLLFFLVEGMQVFRLIEGQTFEIIQSAFLLVFLLMILLAVNDVRRGMLAHDHLMRRKNRFKLSDVE